jgi:hypothetical protein
MPASAPVSMSILVTGTPVTASVAAAGKVYDGTTNLPIGNVACMLSPVVFGCGCQVTSASLISPSGGAFTATVALTPGSNACTLQNTRATGTVNIVPATIIPAVSAADKIYDGTTSAMITLILTGVAPADLSNVSCSAAAANFASANAGTGITVTATGISCSGSAAGNYVLSSNAASTTANIDPATALLKCPYAANTPYPVVAFAAGEVSVCTAVAASAPAPLITYSNVAGKATLAADGHGVLFTTSLGTVTLTATVGGSGTNYVLTTAKGAFTTVKGAPTITCGTLKDVPYGTPPMALTVCSGGDSLAVTYKVVSGPGTITGSAGSQSLKITGAGLITLSAAEAGTADFAAASAQQVTQKVTTVRLDITADPKTWTFDDAKPEFTASAGAGQLVGSDKLPSLSYSTDLPDGADSPLGTYTITPVAPITGKIATDYAIFGHGNSLTYQANTAAGKITVSPAALAFGPVSVSKTKSRTLSITVTNNTGADVTFSAAVSGDNGEVSVVNKATGMGNTCEAYRLNAGSTPKVCTFSVTYAPAAAGAMPATTVQITADPALPNLPVRPLTVSGSGTR